MVCFVPLNLVPTELRENNQLIYSPNASEKGNPHHLFSHLQSFHSGGPQTTTAYLPSKHFENTSAKVQHAPYSEVFLYVQLHSILYDKCNCMTEKPWLLLQLLLAWWWYQRNQIFYSVNSSWQNSTAESSLMCLLQAQQNSEILQSNMGCKRCLEHSHKVSDSFVLWSDPWILQYAVRKHVNVCGLHTKFSSCTAARYTGFCFVLNTFFKDKVFVLVLIFISKLNHPQVL